MDKEDLITWHSKEIGYQEKKKNREKKFTFSPAHPTIPVTTLTASG